MALGSHGITVTMDGWRDMTLRDRAALTEAANDHARAQERAMRAARRKRR